MMGTSRKCMSKNREMREIEKMHAFFDGVESRLCRPVVVHAVPAVVCDSMFFFCGFTTKHTFLAHS